MVVSENAEGPQPPRKCVVFLWFPLKPSLKTVTLKNERGIMGPLSKSVIQPWRFCGLGRIRVRPARRVTFFSRCVAMFGFSTSPSLSSGIGLESLLGSPFSSDLPFDLGSPFELFLGSPFSSGKSVNQKVGSFFWQIHSDSGSEPCTCFPWLKRKANCKSKLPRSGTPHALLAGFRET